MASEMQIDDFIGGPSWCSRFMCRKQLSMRARTTMCQKLPDDFQQKLDSFKAFVQQESTRHSIGWDHIINMDEVPLTFDIPMSRSISEKGEKTINVRTTGHEKSHFTVVLACCADGSKLPPMIIFKRKTMPKEAFPPGVVIQTNVKGWMDESMMGVWLDRCYAKRPDGFFHRNKALLVMDSMRAHITEGVKKKIKKVNSVPVIIPGGMTKMLQPLDIAVNRSFKAVLRRQWEQWMTDGQHSFTTTGRMRHATFKDVSTWIVEAWESITVATIQAGFKKACLISQDTDDSDNGEDANNADDDDDDPDDATDDAEMVTELPDAVAQLFASDTEDEDFDGFQSENDDEDN